MDKIIGFLNKLKGYIPTTLWEGLKEGLRLILIGVVSWLLSFGLLDYLVGTLLGTRIPAEVRVQIMGGLIVILKGVDKFLHEVGKVEKNRLVTGLTRF